MPIIAAIAIVAGASDCLAQANSVTPIDWSRFDEGLGHSPAGQLNREAVQHFDAQLMATEYGFFQGLGRTPDGYLDFGGINESAIRRPAFNAFSVAVSVATGAYDPAIAGQPTAIAESFAIDLGASVAQSHKANGAGGFGDHWQSALWASSAGMSNWLMWDRLSTDDQDATARMVAYEADRFIASTPPSWNGSGGDSKTEENSWNATLLDLAVSMMPSHPNSSLWFDAATRYRVSATATPEDVTSTETLHGTPVGDWVSGYNIYSDGSVVNHNIHPHPTYAGATIKQNGQAINAYGLAGLDTPSSVAHNLDLMYDNLVNADWQSPPYNDPGGTIYQEDGTIFWPSPGENNRRFKYYLFALSDKLVDTLDADGLSGSDASDWELLHWQLTRWQQQNPNAPGSGDGIAGYNPAHGAATSWLTHYLTASDAVRVSDASLDAWPLAPAPVASIINAVSLDGDELLAITIDGVAIDRARLIRASLTHFSDANAAQLVVEDETSTLPAPSGVLDDWSLSTGLANYDEIEVTLDAPISEGVGAELMIVDVGQPMDAFDMTINGVTRSFSSSPFDFATDRMPFDLYESSNGGATDSLEDLDSEVFVVDTLNAESWRVFKLIDLAEFGLAEGEVVTSLSIVNTSGGFDTVAVFGVAPEPAIAGDYNGDGIVDARDYTLARDESGETAPAFAWGSRDPTLEGVAVGAGDHAYWAQHFGETSSSAAESVPEGTSLALLGAAGGLAAAGRFRSREGRGLGSRCAAACAQADPPTTDGCGSR